MSAVKNLFLLNIFGQDFKKLSNIYILYVFFKKKFPKNDIGSIWFTILCSKLHIP